MAENDTTDAGEGHEPDTVTDSVDTSNMTEMEKRLFNIRMKINQGRKANKTEVEEEYKRFTDPKYTKKQKQQIYDKLKEKEFQKKKKDEEDDEDDLDINTLDDLRQLKTKGKNKKDVNMNETAEWAEVKKDKAVQKEENLATFGWKAFTAETSYKAYDKRLKKLPQRSGGSNDELEQDLWNYGQVGTTVSKRGLEKLAQDMEEREEQRRKNSRKKLHIDSADVDYINDKNAQFNKKIKRSFDKYTVEIKQNLERGTAI